MNDHPFGFLGKQTRWYAFGARSTVIVDDRVTRARHDLWLKEARRVWESLKQAAEASRPRLLPQTSLGKAVSYFRNEYTALAGYLDSPECLIENTRIENSIRIPAVGRKR